MISVQVSAIRNAARVAQKVLTEWRQIPRQLVDESIHGHLDPSKTHEKWGKQDAVTKNSIAKRGLATY